MARNSEQVEDVEPTGSILVASDETAQKLIKLLRETREEVSHLSNEQKPAALERYLARVLNETMSSPGAYIRVPAAEAIGDGEMSRLPAMREIIQELKQSPSGGQTVAFSMNACDAAFVNGLVKITLGAVLANGVGAVAGFAEGVVDMYVSC